MKANTARWKDLLRLDVRGRRRLLEPVANQDKINDAIKTLCAVEVRMSSKISVPGRRGKQMAH